jgi:3-hydroxyacyl-CoA dehydrogenase/enoyl-CoA hydratase/carnithine racemase
MRTDRGHFKVTHLGEGMWQVEFILDQSGKSIWHDGNLPEFQSIVDELATEHAAGNVDGVIFLIENHFGANLDRMKFAKDPADIAPFLEAMHTAFNSVEELPFPTLAVVRNGYGGAFELALACRARMGIVDPKGKMGLPEIIMGLFPGAGGSQRLIRLIGMAAFELILQGKMLDAEAALEAGIVDAIATNETPQTEAMELLSKMIDGEAKFERTEHDFSNVDQVAEAAKQQCIKASRGHEFPHHMFCIRAMSEGVKLSLAEGLKLEKKLFLQISGPARGIIHYMMTLVPYAKKLLKSVPAGTEAPEKVGTYGFGLMGSGFAEVYARYGHEVYVYDNFPGAIEKGFAAITENLKKLVKKKKLTDEDVAAIMGRIHVIESPEGFADCDLVIEAVPEELELKLEVFRTLSEIVGPKCLLATNTTATASELITPAVKDPSRFITMHGFSPVGKMKLLEIAMAEETSRETLHRVLASTAAIHKLPIVCQGAAGFVTSSLIFGVIDKGFGFLESGVSVEQIEEAAYDFGFPMALFELMDGLIGLDVVYKAVKTIGAPMPATLEAWVKAGFIGRNKGEKKSIFDEGGKSLSAEALALVVLNGDNLETHSGAIQRGLVETLVKIADRLLKESVVEDKEAIDLGSILGIGFPWYKGGVCFYSDTSNISSDVAGGYFYPDFAA